MESPGTSLGVFPSPDHADFVFGGGAEVIGMRLDFSAGLQRTESLAEQALDFIQQLYTSQSLRGEHFSEINLGIPAFNEAAEQEPQELDYVELLSEQLQQWILTLSEFITLSHFEQTSTNAQKEHLRFCRLMPVSLQSQESGLVDAYTLWSFAYPESPESIQPDGFQLYDSVDYEDLDFGKSSEHLQGYKSELIEKYNGIKFNNYEIEAKKHYLLKKLKDAASTKYELLADQEMLLELLEQEANSSTKIIRLNVDSLDKGNQNSDMPLVNAQVSAQPSPTAPSVTPFSASPSAASISTTNQPASASQSVMTKQVAAQEAAVAVSASAVEPGPISDKQVFLRKQQVKQADATGQYTVPTLDSEVPGDFLSSPAVVYEGSRAPVIGDKILRSSNRKVFIAEAWLFRAVALSAVAVLFYVLRMF